MAAGKGVSLLLLFACICPVLAQDQRRAGKSVGDPLSLVGPGARPEQNNSTDKVIETQQPTPRPQEKPNRGGDLANVASLLQRLSERLSVLQNLAEQQARRLDTLEYRLTRLEVQGQERGEATRAAVAEIARHVQTLAYQGGQISSSVETVRQAQAEARQALTVLATAAVSPQHASAGPVTVEMAARLQGLINSMQNVRTSIATLGEQHNVFARNISSLANVTKQIQVGQQYLATRHGMAASLAEFRLSSTSLSCPLMQQGSLDAQKLPKDCAMVQREQGHNKSGVYLVQPRSNLPPFFTYCELNARGGGWTVIQNRYEGSVDFYRDWVDYKRGFGNLGGEFWLGLDKLHQLTSNEVNELMVELQDFTLDKVHAHYTSFAVGPEVEGYPILFLAGYDGDAGDSLVYHAGMKFSTRDVDNDQWEDGNCAESHLGAWWYNGCDTRLFNCRSNLNGRYLNGALPESHEYQGMYWYDWRGPTYSLMRSRMMIRPRGVSAVPETSTTKASKRGLYSFYGKNMDRTVVVVMVMQLVLCNTQMYDMSDGNDEGLVCPCDGGAIGQCKEEDANLYPGGPTSGSVFSTDISSSCIDVPDQITVTENSKFNMKVHVPYTESWENMKVVLTKDGTIGWFDWFSISGPIPENGRWMEVSIPLPPIIQTGTYEVQIWDNASNNKISIRYFEITEEDLVVTTSTVFTTDSSPASTTITSTASTTVTSTASTIDSSTASTTVTSTASTIDSSTASFTITSTVSTIDFTESTMDLPTVSNTEPTTTMQNPSDSTNVPQDQSTTNPPPRGSKISVWAISCIDVPDPITVTENSNFNMKVHVPYTNSSENMQVFLTVDGAMEKLEWFKISGPILEHWMEVSKPLPSGITEGTYNVSIWDNSYRNKISIRYFEITEEDLSTTTISTTDLTTVSTTDETTTITTDVTEPPSDLTTITTDLTTSITDVTEPPSDLTTSITDVTEPPSDLTTSTTDVTGPPSDLTTITTDVTTITTDVTEFTIVFTNGDTTELTNTDSEFTTPSVTGSTSTFTEMNTEVTDETQDPPKKEPNISIWAVTLGVLIGITAISLLSWFLIVGWRRRRHVPDDMVSLPRLEVVHTSDISTNSSTIGITRKRTQNWVFR
ncbi:hypothetical protein B566_EDAN014611 [Ephemera danica]|nr:hypothetical protein B566_EDAN014611 [Ephemera danica]